MGMGPRVLASASSQMQASISVIKKGAAPFPSQEPVLTSTNAPGYPKKSEEPKLWTQFYGAPCPARMSLDIALLNRCTEGEREAIDRICELTFGAGAWTPRNA